MEDKQKLMTQMTGEQIKKIRQAFDKVDKDGNGRITIGELRDYLKTIGKNGTDEQIKSLLEEVDFHGDGYIYFESFAVTMAKYMIIDCIEEQEILNAFRVFDENGDGFVDAEELRAALENLGEKLTEEEIDEIFREADINHDGKIDYQEFVTYLLKK